MPYLDGGFPKPKSKNRCVLEIDNAPYSRGSSVLHEYDTKDRKDPLECFQISTCDIVEYLCWNVKNTFWGVTFFDCFEDRILCMKNIFGGVTRFAWWRIIKFLYF